MLHNLINGLTALGTGPGVAYLVAGSLLGMFLGVIPGLGGPVVLSIVLAFIYHIDLTGTLSLFLATQAGSYFSASITSILLNTPAHPEAFAVTFDGFPMAQRGEAGRALGISATSTCIGGLIGCAVLVGFIPIIDQLPLLFHPPEYVALISIALLLVGTLGTDAASKALISAGIGLLLSTIGPDPVTGINRYTFGMVGLFGGVALVALFLGLFAIPQMMLVFGTATTIARQDMMGQEIDSAAPVELTKGFGKQVVQGIIETLHHRLALLRAALIGVITGIIPGIGGFAANFMSYGIAQQSSKKRELFGTGIPEGIIAPEGSSLAKEAGGMVPVLGLGIPGGVGNALFLAALTIKGVKVGYGFTASYPTLAYETVWVIALGGLIGTIAGVLTAPQLAKVTRVPGPALVPFIMSIAIVGVYVADVSFFSVMEVMVFAVIGFGLRRLRYSLAAFGIGLILGPSLETNVYLTHKVFPGAHFLERPFADVLFAIGIGVLALKTVQLRREAKRADQPFDEDDVLLRAEELRRRERRRHPYPLLALIATSAILVVTVTAVVYAALQYNLTTALMPEIGGGAAALAALWRMPFEIHAYVRYRRDRRGSFEVLSDRSLPAPVALVGAAAAEHSTAADIIEAMGPAPASIGSASEFEPVQDKSWGIHGQYTREVVAFLWFAVLVGACWLFDFTVGVPLFCLLYGLAATRRILPTWPGRVIFAVASAATMGGTTYEIQHLLHVAFTPVVHF
ncbi:MAG TPA: tripartite tricarboxylate transporter permease [Acidimicrobiales bacterium]|nr:tripartite tricarboxylate transporter permease [Acidimicrobiales bacterium]